MIPAHATPVRISVGEAAINFSREGALWRLCELGVDTVRADHAVCLAMLGTRCIVFGTNGQYVVERSQ